MTDDAHARPVIHPSRHVPMTWHGAPTWTHVLELAGPFALGQRGAVTGPSQSGATSILRTIAQGYAAAVPDATIDVLLIDRPVEEFAEWRMELPGARVTGSASDAGPDAHVAIDDVLDAARDRAAGGADAVVLIDSLAALARALNVTLAEDPRVLTGGLMQQALQAVRDRFGRARAYEPDGSLTIIATSVDDGDAELDTVVTQELVGTGNLEVRLSRDARAAGLWPPIDLEASGARHAELILGEVEASRRARLRSVTAEHGLTAGLALLLTELDVAGSLDDLLAISIDGTRPRPTPPALDEDPLAW